MHTIKLGAHSVPVKRPASYAVERDIVDAIGNGRNDSRVFAAAIGACWAGTAPKLRAIVQPHKFDVGLFGGAVIDELGRDVPSGDIIDAGVQCIRLMQGLPPIPPATPVEETASNLLTEAQERADFCEAPVAAST